MAGETCILFPFYISPSAENFAQHASILEQTANRHDRSSWALSFVVSSDCRLVTTSIGRRSKSRQWVARLISCSNTGSAFLTVCPAKSLDSGLSSYYIRQSMYRQQNALYLTGILRITTSLHSLDVWVDFLMPNSKLLMYLVKETRSSSIGILKVPMTVNFSEFQPREGV